VKAKRLVMMMAALFPFTGNAFAQLPDKEPVAIGRTRIVHALEVSESYARKLRDPKPSGLNAFEIFAHRRDGFQSTKD
jgi:hypothetical protein